MIAGDYGGIGVSLEHTTYCLKSISKIRMWLSVIKHDGSVIFIILADLHFTMCITVNVTMQLKESIDFIQSLHHFAALCAHIT